MEPYIGDIIMFGSNFAPRGWAFCNGQLMPIAQNTALFSIIGTTYGGDGRTTFALPDLRSRAPMHTGHGPGLTSRRLGQRGGTETNTLNITQMPSHNHGLIAGEEGNTEDPNGNFIAGSGTQAFGTTSDVNMNNAAVSNTGSSQPINNIQPFQCVNFIISLDGQYPSRS